MTTIQRLGIQGIRSYGPDQEQSIVFTPPLTLIVGSNGCGKTTVIESLRMATCGVLPPNSGSGQAFVHDPRVSAAPSTETKAKIRLKSVHRHLCATATFALPPPLRCRLLCAGMRRGRMPRLTLSSAAQIQSHQ